jgi:Na+/H+-dicarboxylate symporter
MELNLINHLHCIVGFIINCGLLFNWAGIHLYLVIVNKIFTNLLKAMLSLNHYLLIILTLHMSPTVSELMHIISHNLLSDERM